MWEAKLWPVLCPAVGPHSPACWEGESQARSQAQWLRLVEAQEGYASVHRDLELHRFYFRCSRRFIFLVLVLNLFFWKEKVSLHMSLQLLTTPIVTALALKRLRHDTSHV